MGKPDKLREYDKDMILAWFAYRLDPETRRALWQELPEAYNRWVGQEVVIVIRTPDAT